jgi:hypothetical protein
MTRHFHFRKFFQVDLLLPPFKMPRTAKVKVQPVSKQLKSKLLAKSQPKSLSLLLQWDDSEPNSAEVEKLLRYRYGGVRKATLGKLEVAMDFGYHTIQEQYIPESQCFWVPLHYWPALVLLDWTIAFWSAVCLRTTRELGDRPYILAWNQMSKTWLKYHCKARDLVKGEAADLLQGDGSLDGVRLPLLDEWMGRTFWGVHLICDEDLPLVQRALQVDFFDKKSKKEIGKSQFPYLLPSS